MLDLAHKLKKRSAVRLTTRDLQKKMFGMPRLLTLFAVLLLLTATFANTAQAQQRTTRRQVRAAQQPRAFTRHTKPRAFRQTQSRTRAHVVRPRGGSPRFYGSNPGARASQSLRDQRKMRRYRVAPRVSVPHHTRPRRAAPRFYGSPSTTRASQIIQRRSRSRTATPRRATLRTVRPTFWR